MLGGAIIIVLLFAFIWLTIKDALQFGWGALIVVILSLLLWLVVKLVVHAKVQAVIATLAIGVAVVAMATFAPLHVTSIICMLIVVVTLVVAAALASNWRARPTIVKLMSAQLLWLIPLALTTYTYGVDPGAILVPGSVLILGVIAAIPAGAI